MASGVFFISWNEVISVVGATKVSSWSVRSLGLEFG
jgi:hypothetical protein